MVLKREINIRLRLKASFQSHILFLNAKSFLLAECCKKIWKANTTQTKINNRHRCLDKFIGNGDW